MKPQDCIFFQLSRVSRAGARHWHNRVGRFGVTSAQALVLLFLLEEDRITSRELGSKLEFDSATLTGLVDRLEKLGFAERKNNPQDRRTIHICLTPEGTATARKISAIVEPENEAFLSGLTEAETMILRTLLKKLG